MPMTRTNMAAFASGKKEHAGMTCHWLVSTMQICCTEGTDGWTGGKRRRETERRKGRMGRRAERDGEIRIETERRKGRMGGQAERDGKRRIDGETERWRQKEGLAEYTCPSVEKGNKILSNCRRVALYDCVLVNPCWAIGCNY